MYCPKCEARGEMTEMNEMFSFDSDTGKMEIVMECINPKCPAKFLGTAYLTTKEVA